MMFLNRPGDLTLDLADGLNYFFPRRPFALDTVSCIGWGLEHQMPPGKVFLDIGANIGTWTLPYARSRKPSRVHSWEPQRSTRDCLLAGVYTNGLSDIVEVHPEALGSREQVGMSALHVFTDEGGASSLIQDVGFHWPWTREEMVEVRTLDGYGFTDVGLVKVDVEGNELEVLRGGVGTLEGSDWPPVFFEAWQHDWYKEQKQALFDFITGLGYSIHPLNELPEDFLAVRS